MKLPLMFKGFSVAFVSMLETMARSIDDIGYHLLHPVRTIRWRSISLPIAIIWTALAGISAWTNFNAGPFITTALAITSIYLLSVGIIQQLFPSKSA